MVPWPLPPLVTNKLTAVGGTGGYGTCANAHDALVNVSGRCCISISTTIISST